MNDRTVRLKMPIAAAIGAGVLSLAVLITYFLSFGGTANLTPMLAFNAARMSPGGEPLTSIVRNAVGVATQTVWTIGPVLLASALVACLAQPRDGGLLALLTAYVLATIAFNVIFYRLPGSGSYYLHSAVPAIAILTGAAAGALIDVVRPVARGAAILLVIAAVQLVAAPPSLSVVVRSQSVQHAAVFAAQQAERTGPLLVGCLELSVVREIQRCTHL
jgi:hypothetical protein